NTRKPSASSTCFRCRDTQGCDRCSALLAELMLSSASTISTRQRIPIRVSGIKRPSTAHRPAGTGRRCVRHRQWRPRPAPRQASGSTEPLLPLIHVRDERLRNSHWTGTPLQPITAGRARGRARHPQGGWPPAGGAADVCAIPTTGVHTPMNPANRLLVAAIAFAVTGGASADPPELRFVERPVQGQYIVVLKDEVAALAHENSRRPRIPEVANEMARRHGMQVQQSFTRALRGFVARADDKALERLLMDDRVAYVEEDGYVSASATQTGATWGIDRIDQRNLPLSGTYTYDTTASNVHAYVIDTGVLASHSQFGGRVSGGYTAINDGRGTNDCNGHGTHVAGTVAGSTYGVAKAARVHPVRVLGCNGSGT